MKDTSARYSELKDLIIDKKTDEFIAEIKEIERGINLTHETFDMLLSDAAFYDDEKACKQLINQGADPTYAFEAAFGRNLVESVETLIKSGAEWDEGVFRYAARNGHINLLEPLLEKGFDVQYESNYGIKQASEYGLKDTCKFLLEKGANAGNDETLTNAANRKNLDLLKTSLSHGANVHCLNENPLIQACSNNATVIAKVLLEHGANPHANDDEPLKYACKYDAKETIHLLLIENKMPVKTLTREWLTANNYRDVMQLITKRDLAEKMETKMPPKQKVKNSSFTMKL